MPTKHWLSVAALLVAAWGAPAQQFTFRNYRQPDGLGNLSPTCLTQDHAGFIWICTENGLFRHDGKAIEHIGEDEGLVDSAIRILLEDSSHRLWVGTSHDLYLGDGRQFHAVRPEGHNIGFGSGFKIAAETNGRLLAISGRELLELQESPVDGLWHSRPYFSAEQLHTDPQLHLLNSIYIDRNDGIWLGCGSGICSVENGRVTLREGVPVDSWHAFLLDATGHLWVRGTEHVVELPPGATRFEVRDPPHAKLTSEIVFVPIAADQDGRILVTNDVGLARWDEGHWTEFTAANGITDAGIPSLLVDRDGTVWMGMDGQGLARWLGYGHFESWTTAQGLGNDTVWKMLRNPEGGLSLATRAGCYRLDEATRLASPCRIQGLPPGEMQMMSQRADGSLWLTMTAGGLYRIPQGAGRAELIANTPLTRQVYVDSTDRLWISTNTGVFVVPRGTSQVNPVALPSGAGEVADVAEDATGAIWFASQGGLIRWVDGNAQVLRIDDEHARQGFNTVSPAADGWLWAGGLSHGLLHVRVAGDHADRLEWVSHPGVARSLVFFSQIDARGWLWVGTDAGVAVFDGRAWRSFTQLDGLIWNDLNENSIFADKDGSLWMGSSGGLIHVVRPEGLMQSAPLDLKIVRATLGGQTLNTPTAPRIPWKAGNALDLHLAELDFGEAGQTVLQVRLRGLSDEWFETHDYDLHYPGLEPGRYTFEAVGVSPHLQRQSGLVQRSFDILPPWWRTLWFYFLLAAVLIATLAVVWNWRMRKLSEHKKVLELRLQEHKALLVRATRDSLTGLWNRTAILEILTREIDSARAKGTSLAVALMDIDHFKRINDTRGHLAGDEVLRTLGGKLANKIRTTDSLGRFGGEEFLLVLPATPRQAPFLPLERLHRAIAEIPFVYDGVPIKVTASLGVAWLEATGDSMNNLIGRADAALYSAKYAGRNRVEYSATG
jgi:diguanylate cyclase (GGDEF)-like protein